MQIDFNGLRRCGVVLAVVALAACNGGAPGEDELPLGETEQELSCTAPGQCLEAALCFCGSERFVVSKGAYNPFRCTRAMETARTQAYAAATAACSAGYCNAVEQELRCEQAPDGRHHALFQLTYSCKDPVTCQ